MMMAGVDIQDAGCWAIDGFKSPPPDLEASFSRKLGTSSGMTSLEQFWIF